MARRSGNPGFDGLRAAPNATEAKRIYNEIRQREYPELPQWTKWPSLRGVLEEWEREHPERLEEVEDRSVGFGARGADLGRLLEPVFIPAVHDAALESEDTRASHLRVLVERVVKPAEVFDQRAEEIDEDFRRRYNEMIGDAGTVLSDAARAISGRLGRFAPGAEVQLEWEGRPPEVSTPGVRVRLVEGGHAAEIGRQGHGVQRAYILALLQELAGGSLEEDEPGPLLVLMIEEPELYQHPSRSRMLARILAELVAAEDAGTQVVFATHSPEFVSLEQIDALRLFRLDPVAATPSTRISLVDLESVANALWVANGSQGDPFTADTIRPRLRHLATMPIAEGFFADSVVLVEGEEDRAFIMAAAQEADIDLDGRNVVIIPVGGKANLDRPLLVFRQLGTPVYLIFDSDGHLTESERSANEKLNQRLCSLLGIEAVELLATRTEDTWTAFEETLERTIRQEAGDDRWDEALREAADCAGYVKVSDAKKNPVIVRDAYERLRAVGGGSETLESVIGRIRELFGL